MSAKEKLDAFYSRVDIFTIELAKLPNYKTFEFFQTTKEQQTIKTQTQINPQDFIISEKDRNNAIIFAKIICLILFPILLPLSIATFAIALAIDLVSKLSKIITYPSAAGLDYCWSQATK